MITKKDFDVFIRRRVFDNVPVRREINFVLILKQKSATGFDGTFRRLRFRSFQRFDRQRRFLNARADSHEFRVDLFEKSRRFLRGARLVIDGRDRRAAFFDRIRNQRPNRRKLLRQSSFRRLLTAFAIRRDRRVARRRVREPRSLPALRRRQILRGLRELRAQLVLRRRQILRRTRKLRNLTALRRR